MPSPGICILIAEVNSEPTPIQCVSNAPGFLASELDSEAKPRKARAFRCIEALKGA